MNFRDNLVERYRACTDDELMEVAQAKTLTDLAQEVVEREMKQRGITLPAAIRQDEGEHEEAVTTERSPFEELETIARFFNVADAHILRGKMEAEDIPAYVLDTNLAIANPLLMGSSGIRVQVPRSYMKQATELMQSIKNGDHGLDAQPADGPIVDPMLPLSKKQALLAFAQDDIWLKIWRRQIDRTGHFWGFNPFAMVLGTVWFFFRKMYVLGVVMLLLDIATLYFIRVPGVFFIPRIAAGLFANIAYYDKAMRAIEEVGAIPAVQATRKLNAKGGISPLAALISLMLIFLAANGIKSLIA